ncbi:ABC transporter ATP-binding protein [Desulfurococcus amylolyticus]|uniref:Sigma 54 interacting domain protein n=1 Tax=Desulfurococcus amylolyticus DSM 16532 TaxID=768672 RepID=I3XQJ7_DESAM|nr:ABC transporter ATP-binding protein [Desulfurococcus amylolyticus]AFL66221.1 Sigma 54 interacting domain protein [Desulfurococcus amylolyticus DSM 16532]
MGLGDIIRLEDVTAGYVVVKQGIKSIAREKRVVLRNINLRIKDGERVVIIGESGSGKTTLLRVILGLLKPFNGRVFVIGKDIYSLKWRERVKVLRQIGYVPQDPYKALNPSVKVGTILEEPLEALSISERGSRVKDILRLVNLPENVLNMYPMELSGGMRQRVLIARAIIHDPEVLILDEPTSALDVSMQAQIVNLINEIHRKLELAVLTVTHDLGVAQYLADRAVVLYRGEIIEEGDIDSIIKNPRNEYTRLLVSSY